ncbi:hypothetical protein B1A99_16120 [Cohnella sp. CIP 111063]|uniref:chemotaxis protein CheW n=1 Tax=unclassified Cohnella TaxID=2636738 RepID=UPI000B8C3A2D|nr:MULTISPECIES: chemotaxis protein CheW [unclassified Cohnella]OXS57586.1 hypothetical protein B1A99_16120 [Cohnella sp. CIP 111063]PRX70964.1 purine-binding chemotaxis protein CheW [Cohnella sp. SGD-V74]
MQAIGQSAERQSFIDFVVAGRRYAVRVQELQDIIRHEEITRVPNAGAHVEGLIVYLGRIVPVLNLRGLFRLHGRERGSEGRIMVVRRLEQTAGLMIDDVKQVIAFSEIQPPPDSMRGVEGRYFTGVGMSAGEAVGLLKLDEVLIPERERIG